MSGPRGQETFSNAAATYRYTEMLTCLWQSLSGCYARTRPTSTDRTKRQGSDKTCNKELFPSPDSSSPSDRWIRGEIQRTGQEENMLANEFSSFLPRRNLGYGNEMSHLAESVDHCQNGPEMEG